MMLQKLTTGNPDDSMVEVAIIAFKAAQEEVTNEELDELVQRYYRPVSKKENEQAAAPIETAMEAEQ